MKILLIGGAGFIGSHIAQEYLKNNYQVFLVDKKPLKNLRSDLIGRVTYFQQDINEQGLENIFSQVKPDVVNHHAALISVGDSWKHSLDYTKTNVLATIKILELCDKFLVKQFIFASSSAVYGNCDNFPIKEDFYCIPESIYGFNKYSAENSVKLFSNKFRASIFRYANVFGPFQDSSAEGGVVAIFAKNLIKCKPTTIYGNGLQTRDFIFVKDVAKANLLAIRNKLSETVNISSNRSTSIIDLYSAMKKIINQKINSQLIYRDKRVGDIEKSLLDNKKAERLLNWKPEHSLEEGLEQTIEYFLRG